MQKSRRNFLKAGLASMSVATLSSGSMAAPVEAPQKFDETYDMVILGAGGAGLSAACHALDKGLKVLVVEKMSFPGGSSAISGGQWAVAGSKFQQEKGIKDDHALFIKDMMQVGHGVCKQELVEAFVKASSIEFDWFIKNSGMKPITIMVNSGMSVPRSHRFDSSKVTMFYHDYAVKHGAKIYFDTKAEHLLWNNAKKEIVGVQVKRENGKKAFIGSKKGILIATGGFARNKELLAKYSPKSQNAVAISGAGTTGDGMLMAQEYGADVLDVAYVKPTYGFTLNPKHVADKSSVFYAGAIIVNRDAKRFIRENDSYKTIGEAALSQKNGESFMVFDETIRIEALPKDPREKRFIGEKGKTDFGFVGNTIEDVAKKAGLDPKILAQTVAEYNKHVPDASDPMGRNTLAGNFGKPIAIQKPPFVIIPATACLLSTYCGLRVDPQLRVIDVFGKPINGLFAAGEVCGGFHGESSMSGTGFGKAFSLGRLAFESMSKR